MTLFCNLFMERPSYKQVTTIPQFCPLSETAQQYSDQMKKNTTDQ